MSYFNYYWKYFNTDIRYRNKPATNLESEAESIIWTLWYKWICQCKTEDKTLLINKKKKEKSKIDLAVPINDSVKIRGENTTNTWTLTESRKHLYNTKWVVISTLVGALGTFSKDLEWRIGELEYKLRPCRSRHYKNLLRFVQVFPINKEISSQSDFSKSGSVWSVTKN